MEKRIISLGFEEPSKLETDVIYLTIYYGQPHIGSDEDDLCGLYVDLVSNDLFTYHVNENQFSQKSKTWLYSENNSQGVDELIKDLVESNDGILDHSRMIDQGCKNYAKIEDVLKLLKPK